MKKIFFCLLIFVLAQTRVYSADSSSAMSKVLNSWVGYNINEVISVWGYPVSEKIIADRKLYIWEEHSFYISGNQYSTSGGENYCIRTLEADENNDVKSWEWKGNDCPILRCTSEKWVNPVNNPWKKEKMQKKNFKIFD